MLVFFLCRQALRKKIEEFVIPLMAVILCNIDVGNNLNNLKDFGNLWIRLFEDSTVMSELTYAKQMFSVGKDGIRTPLKQFSISSAVPLGTELRFPFSWILKRKLDETVETAKSIHGKQNTSQSL